jgi:F-type H+-transporting ATPase subunit delta
MASATRQSTAKAMVALKPLLAKADIKFAEELFTLGAVLASSAQLRGILSDPSADKDAKAGVVKAVFGKVASKPSLDFLNSLVVLRWSRPRDLAMALETLAVHAVASIAAAKKKLDELESSLFGFQQAIETDSELQFALADKSASEQAKTKLVDTLIKGKASAEAALLIRRAVLGSGNRRASLVLETFGKQVSAFADRLVAVVTVAAPIDAKQLARLEKSLAASYGQSLKLNLEIDPAILGGIRVQIAGDVIDGTLVSRLNEAKLQLA